MLDKLQNASGFIFDCDGTLLDSMPIWDVVEQDLMQASGHDFTQEELEEVRAAPIAEAGRIFHEKYGLGNSSKEVVDRIDDQLLGFYRSSVNPLPGAVAFVEKIHELGIPCTVVSSSPKRYIDAGFMRCGMYDRFVKVISTEDDGISKRDPQIFLNAIEAMGSDIATTWGADDSIYAIKVMKDMGLNTIGVYYSDSTGSKEQMEKHCDIVIDSFKDLAD